MNQTDEQQRSFRMQLNAEVICSMNGDDFQGKVRNMSSTGFYMESAQCPPTGSTCNIQIYLYGAHSRLMIDELRGTVKRSDEHGVGIELDDRLEWVALVPIYFQ